MVLEDLRWADPESLDLLDYLADHAGEVRLRCVVTARPGPSAGMDVLNSLVGRRAATVYTSTTTWGRDGPKVEFRS